MLLMVRLGSNSASNRLSCGSSAPGDSIGHQHDPANKVRTQLDFLHQFVGVINLLRQRHVEHRPRRPVQAPSREFRVAHDAYDPVCAGIFGHVDAEMLLDRVFLALEKTLHKCLVHNRHRSCRFIVCCREVSPAQNRHSKVLQIIALSRGPTKRPIPRPSFQVDGPPP